MRHKWVKIPTGNMANDSRYVQKCANCGMIRINAYRGKLQYYLSDGVTSITKAGECNSSYK